MLPLFSLLLAMFSFTDLAAVPRQNNSRGYDDDKTVAVQEMRDTISDMRYQVNNHESEIREFDEKLKNLDSIIESLRDQFGDATKSHKEQLKGNSVTLEGKITSLETTSKGLISDLRQFKTHANESATALAQYKQKITELEKIVEQQNQNIEHLQSAMRSIMEALQGKDVASTSRASSDSSEGLGENSYRIKAGDSLEKIARSHQTTIQALKDLNGLTSDKIVVGKVLMIPEKK